MRNIALHGNRYNPELEKAAATRGRTLWEPIDDFRRRWDEKYLYWLQKDL